MAWFWILISVITLICFLQQLLSSKKHKKKLPPGPIGLPIVGHLHQLGKNLHYDMHRLAKKHGPIIYLRLGFVPAVVVSSPEIAELVLKTHDLVFAGRPHHQAAKYLTYDRRDIVFAPYGAYWRNMRKLCTLELLSCLRVSQFRSMRRGELGLFVDSLRKLGENREIVNVSARVSGSIGDMASLMVFGRKYVDRDLDEKGFKSVIEEMLQIGATPNLGDFFPFIAAFDFQGLDRRMKKLSGTFDGFLERIIDEHVKNRQGKKQSQDFVDTLMGILDSGEAGFDFDRRHVKAVLLDMFTGGMDSSSLLVEWALTELIRHPKVMKKLQNELEQVVGADQIVDESHLDKLEYLNLVVKETFRLHPSVPLPLHQSLEDCMVGKYHVPKGSWIFVNIYSIGKDPNIWDNPEKFAPERFVGSNVDVLGQHFELIPFGSGRRGCPGIQLALTVVRLVVAQLVHCFDWELPDGSLPADLDMGENFGMVTGKTMPLMAIPTYRLCK